MRKPTYLFLYKNECAVDDLMNQTPFRHATVQIIKRNSSEAYIEYEHFTIKCIRMFGENESIRGHKAWQVLVEDVLYDTLSDDYIRTRLRPIAWMYDLVGGKVIRVEKYYNEGETND